MHELMFQAGVYKRNELTSLAHSLLLYNYIGTERLFWH